MAKWTVVCPHCGNTVTLQIGDVANGGGSASCRVCHKMVNIQIRNGELYEVRKG